MQKTILLQLRMKDEATIAKQERYQGMTGFIMFSIVETRPNISFATSARLDQGF